MTKSVFSLAALILCSAPASAAIVYFETNFDEADFASTGLTADTPAPAAGQGNDGSGTIMLDTVTQSLDISAMDANMWDDRDGAPIAWVASPTVALGQTWVVETQITHTDSPGGVQAGYDQAGMTFYSGTAGANPGSENTGMHQSLFLGISDWNAWNHQVQGFADNNPSAAVGATLTDTTFEYRTEITEGGVTDTYNFFYREAPTDSWTQIGPANLAQDFDNSAVGLFLKTHNNNPGSSTEFGYLHICVEPIPEPSSTALVGLSALGLLLRRRRS